MPNYIFYAPIDNPRVELMAAIRDTGFLSDEYDPIYEVSFLSSERELDFFYPDRHAEYTEAGITEAIELHAAQWRIPQQ